MKSLFRNSGIDFHSFYSIYLNFQSNLNLKIEKSRIVYRIIATILLITDFFFFFLIFNIDLSARVDAVKEENLKLKSENQVLGQYIENLMSASSVFQTTDTKSKRK